MKKEIVSCDFCGELIENKAYADIHLNTGIYFDSAYPYILLNDDIILTDVCQLSISEIIRLINNFMKSKKLHMENINKLKAYYAK